MIFAFAHLEGDEEMVLGASIIAWNGFTGLAVGAIAYTANKIGFAVHCDGF